MRAAWAIFLSIAAHGAVLGGIFLYNCAREPGTELVVEAPIGDVFVQEDAGASPPQQPLPQEQKQEQEQGQEQQQPQQQTVGKPESFPETGVSPTTNGLPDGDAHPVGMIRPEYPAMSRKLGEEGEAAFWIDIGADGAVANVRLDRSSGHERLDQAAQAALQEAHFQPSVRNGSPAASTKRFRIEFRLSSPPRAE